MTRTNWVARAGIAGCVLLCACSTIRSVTSSITPASRNYADLPVEELREVAREIERSVFEQVTEPRLTSSGTLRVDDPRIVQSIRTRSLRYSILDAFRSRGHSWERRNGRLWIIRSSAYRDSTTSQQRNRDAFLVYSENEDRWRLYEAIIDANDLRNDTLQAIEEVFFEARLEFMGQGQLYENSQGDPVAKQDSRSAR